MSLEQVKAQVVAIAHKLARMQWVANHDGNVSFRLPEGRFVATPTATHKGDVDHTMLVIVDIDGKVLEGTRKIFGEWEMHRAIYNARPDVMAIVHAHPPYATACAVAGVSLGEPVMVEPVVSLGYGIGTVPFFAPKSEAGLAALADAATHADAWLLENHGAISFGTTLEQAYLRMELTEHQAKIQTIARTIGGVRPLPQQVVAPLLEARKTAGLAAPAETTEIAQDLRETIARLVAQELRQQ